MGRPNVGKSALFNRLVRRKEALVYNTPDSHVTRDHREGLAQLADLQFRVLDSAGLEPDAKVGGPSRQEGIHARRGPCLPWRACPLVPPLGSAPSGSWVPGGPS